VAYTGVKVLAPAFYALGTPRVPLLASGLAVVTNVVVILTLRSFGGYGAVALGTSLGSFANVALLAAMFERRVGGLLDRPFLGAIARMVAAAAVMAPAAVWTASALEAAVGTRGLRAQLVTGLVPVMVGVVVYGLAALALRIPEAGRLVGALRPRR
jgi:putative peptidoglycan lipid II flippase